MDDEYMMMLDNVAKKTHHRQHISEETEGETPTTMKTLRAFAPCLYSLLLCR